MIVNQTPKLIIIIIAILLFSAACTNISSSTASNTSQFTLTPSTVPTGIPKPTITPSPTATTIPVVYFEGRLFFDINNTGIQETGEPGLANIQACAIECVQTDQNGDFVIPDQSGTPKLHITVTDLNEGESLRMMFIPSWKGLGTIPTWEWNGIRYSEQVLGKRDVFPINNGIIYLERQETTLA